MASEKAENAGRGAEEISRGGSCEVARISKPDMYMAVALWMERSPLAQSPSEYLPPRGDQVINKSGAVFVLPNDRALSVDCSKEGVHAAVSALNKFGQERAKGCLVYLSRRPCSFCAKLLMQCEVSRVCYLPIEPELDDAEDVRRVDTLFMTSGVGLSIKVPKIEESVVEDHDHRISPYTGARQTGAEADFSAALLEEYWNDGWVERASDVLNWPAFRDVNLQFQMKKDMEGLMKWIAHTTVKDVPDDIIFVEMQSNYRPKEQNVPDDHDEAVASETGSKEHDEGGEDVTPQSSPTQQADEVNTGIGKRKEDDQAVSSGDKEWQNRARHMSRLAQMLSQRSDDPTRRVGCVLMVHSEIAAIGWNGFPAKALYGEFPRSSDTEEERNKKEPYVIHAEQNALLTRNKGNLHHDSSFLFVNEVPCDECVPLLIQAGVRKFVIPKLEGPEIGEDQIAPSDSKKAFKDAFKAGKFECFGSKRSRARRNLNL